MATKEKSPMPTLYDLSEELQLLQEDLAAWAEDHEGDVTNYPMERIEKLEGDVKAKVLKIAELYKALKAEGKAIAEEKKTLAAREKAKNGRGDRLREYMASVLPPNAKYEGPRAAVSWKNNPPAVKLCIPEDKLDSLPARYQRITREANLEALKADMVEADIPATDNTGAPILDADEKPILVKALQVTWPMPTGEKRMVAGDDDGGEPHEVDVLEERVIARMVQGRSLLIR